MVAGGGGNRGGRGGVMTDLDPKDIPPGAVILSDDLYSPIAWLIRLITHRRQHVVGSYSHGMIAGRVGHVISQGALLREQKIDRWLRRCRLKVWVPVTPAGALDWMALDEMFRAATRRLAKRWWKRMYDPLGILGQWLGARWLQSPWADYCTEMTGEVAWVADSRIPIHESPAGLNAWFKQHGDRWMELGVIEPE